MRPFFLAAFLAACQVVTASNVLVLDAGNFEEVVLNGKPSMVEFYAVSTDLSTLSCIDQVANRKHPLVISSHGVAVRPYFTYGTDPFSPNFIN